MRLLLASAALFVATLGSHCLAVTPVTSSTNQVVMDLTGQVVASGSTVLATSGTIAIDKSPIYYYSISGTLVGHGAFAPLTSSSGSSLNDLLEETDPTLVPYLGGFVLDSSSKFPFTAVNKLAKGTFTVTSGQFNGSTATGTVRAKAGISNKGIAYGELTNLLYTAKVVILGNVKIPGADGWFSFTSGQVVVQTSPILSSTGAQPNLSFQDAIGHLDGLGVTGTDAVGHSEGIELKKGKSASFIVALENAGSLADTYTLTATPAGNGFAQKFIYKGKNITPAVTGAGFTLPPAKGATTETLPSGGAATLTWQITNKTAATANTTAPVFTAASQADPTKTDSLVITGTGL